MPEFPPILLSGLTGFVFGLLLAIPVGPVNLTIMNEGARQGFKYAALVSSGALLMEIIYCSLAFTGFAAFFDHGFMKTAMQVFSFAFMIVLGIKFLQAKSVPAATRIEERIEGRLKPHSAFMTGFVRVMGNLGVFGSWIVLGSNFISRGVVEPTLQSKGACVAGVALGTGLWFFGLGYAVSLGHKKFSEKTLLRMEHGSGIALLLMGIVHGVQIVMELRRYK